MEPIRESLYVTFNIETIFSKVENGTINLCPKYQRGFVWSNTKKIGLIDSIMNGYPVPNLMFSQVDMANFNVMDGKQRIEAIMAFKKNKLMICIDGIKYKYDDMSERQQAKFDVSTFSVSISTNLTAEEESFLYERINRASPLSSGEMFTSYLYSAFTRTREEYFDMKNPLFRELCEYMGCDDKGQQKRQNKIADWSGYIAGLAMGPEYITSSFIRLQPLLEMDDSSWEENLGTLSKNFELYVGIWRAVIIENGVVLPKDWLRSSRVWRMGFLNAFIIYSLWVDDVDYVKDIWVKFIEFASMNWTVLSEWKQSFGANGLSLNEVRLYNGWYQVQYFVENRIFNRDIMYKKSRHGA